MMLRISSLELGDFRNYRRFRLSDIGDITLFVGPNAVGKTNIVEGIQLLTALTSFRHPKISHLIREGAQRAHAGMHVTDGSRELDVEMTLAEGKRGYSLNGKAKRPVDLKGLVPSVVFTPDGLGIVKGGSSGRRAVLDALGSQLVASYYKVKHDYDEILRSKNRLLKTETDPTFLDSVDDMVVRVGAQLTCYRAALFARLMPHLVSHYASLSASADEVTARYLPSWEDDEGKRESFSLEVPSRDEARERIAAAIRARKDEERARRMSVVGPHADKIDFFIDGRNAAQFASQGQQRSIVLAEKLAEVSLVREMLGQSPVLLLDDVMSELDEGRREALIAHIGSDVQTFITTTNLSYFDGDIERRATIVSLPLEAEGETR